MKSLLKQIVRQMIDINNYPNIGSSIFGAAGIARHRIYNKFFKRNRSFSFFYPSANERDKAHSDPSLENLKSPLSDLITDKFTIDGISSRQEALPEDEHLRIINGTAQLEKFCILYNSTSNQHNGQSLELTDFSSAIRFIPLNKSYYKDSGPTRFYSVASGEKLLKIIQPYLPMQNSAQNTFSKGVSGTQL